MAITHAQRGHHLQLSYTQKRNFFWIVDQGSEAWRLSLGKIPTKLNPGLHLFIPLYHQIDEVDLRERQVQIRNLGAFTSDNVPFVVDWSLFYQVQDSYKALFNVTDYGRSTESIGTSGVRSVLGNFQYDEIIGDRNQINTKLQQVIDDGISSWGINCTRFEIQNFAPAHKSVRANLEKQMEAERDRRKQLLDTEAEVNVAEGEYVRVIKEAEAKKMSLILEAQGLADQMLTIATNITNGDYQAAIQMLLELKRIDQLAAIAKGENNSIYFAQDPQLAGSAHLFTDTLETIKSRHQKEQQQQTQL